MKDKDGNYRMEKLNIAAWNINGIRAVLRKGDLQQYLEEFQPDILTLG